MSKREMIEREFILGLLGARVVGARATAPRVCDIAKA
jgi:hypothetical protein